LVVVDAMTRQQWSEPMRVSISVLSLLLAGFVVPAVAQQPAAKTGVLLLAHGGQAQWNERVADVAKRVDQQHPTEIAFGMATRANIQAAIDKLTARGVAEIVAVPRSEEHTSELQS